MKLKAQHFNLSAIKTWQFFFPNLSLKALQISIIKASKQNFVLATICNALPNNNKQKVGGLKKGKIFLSSFSE